ncbi:MAG: hypothetical protein ABI342_04560 [Nitrososphaera sp.]
MSKKDTFEYVKVTNLAKWKIDQSQGIEITEYPYGILSENRWIFLTANEQKLWNQIFTHSLTLNDQCLAEPFTGIQSSLDKVYVIRNWKDKGDLVEFQDNDGKIRVIEKSILKPYLLPGNTGETSFRSFQTKEHDGWLVFPYHVKDEKAKTIPEIELKKKYPRAYEYLLDYKSELSKRDLDKHSSDWYRFGRSQSLTRIENQPKIIVGVLFKEERYVYDENNMYFQTGDTAGYVGIKMRNNSQYSIFYVMGLLNHKALEWVSSKMASVFEGDYIAHGQTLLRDLPIRKINFNVKKEKDMHDEISDIVKDLIMLHKKLKKLKTEREIFSKQKEIEDRRDLLDKKINSLWGIETLMQYADVV